MTLKAPLTLVRCGRQPADHSFVLSGVLSLVSRFKQPLRMVSSKVTGLMALALQVTVFSAQAQGDVCLTPPTRCMPVHGSPTWSEFFPQQTLTHTTYTQLTH